MVFQRLIYTFVTIFVDCNAVRGQKTHDFCLRSLIATYLVGPRYQHWHDFLQGGTKYVYVKVMFTLEQATKCKVTMFLNDQCWTI
jgi:hypothetical protein